MTENKINPLLDAISEIDDNIITNTKKTKKRPLLIAAVAAAASLAVIMGAAVVNKTPLTVNNEHVMDYNLTVQKNVNTDPHEQLLEMGATNSRYSWGQVYELTARPSEVFEVLNIQPLMNDCFADEATEIVVRFNNFRDTVGYLDVRYCLTDKKTDVEMSFTLSCTLVKGANLGIGYEGEGIKEYELLDLNDGSKAMFYGIGVTGSQESTWYGSFCYDGIIYHFSTNVTGYDAFMQTIDDLGIL